MLDDKHLALLDDLLTSPPRRTNQSGGTTTTLALVLTPSTLNELKTRAESYPQSELEALKQQIQLQKGTIEKLKEHNQQLTDEREAYRQFLGIPVEPPAKSTPNMVGTTCVVKVGYLIKRGFTWHNWCTRWCVLRGGTLTYFKSPSDSPQKPKGMFHVYGCEVDEFRDRPFAFTVQSRNRLWFFGAANVNEQKSWMQALRMAAQQEPSMKPQEITDSGLPLNGKLFRFFGEQPNKDWEERVRKETLKQMLRQKDNQQQQEQPSPPVPKEVLAFITDKETKLLEECELTLPLVHAHLPIFLNCAYFVTRDRYFKTKIEEYSTVFNVRSPTTVTSSHRQGNRRSRKDLATSRESGSGIYTDALGKILCLQNPREIFTILEKIGKGGFAEVYAAKNKKTKEMVAVKVLSQKFQKKNTRMCHEVSMLISCHHPNIIKNVQNFLYNEEIYMVTEFCEVGSIDRLLKFDLPEAAIAFITGQVLNGLSYLHKMGRVHRDIKCSNILVNSQGQIKIADLGLCEDLKDGTIVGKMSGSKYWLAPEVIARKPYGTAADIWNVGCLCSALATKTPPNGHMHPVKAMFLVAAQGVSVSRLLPKTREWSSTFRDFLELCFKLDPAQRPSSTELLQHPFIKKGKRSEIMAAINCCMITELII